MLVVLFFFFLSRSSLGFSLLCWTSRGWPLRLHHQDSLAFWLPLVSSYWRSPWGRGREWDWSVYSVCSFPDWWGLGCVYVPLLTATAPVGCPSRGYVHAGFSNTTCSPCPFRPRSSNSTPTLLVPWVLHRLFSTRNPAHTLIKSPFVRVFSMKPLSMPSLCPWLE